MHESPPASLPEDAKQIHGISAQATFKMNRLVQSERQIVTRCWQPRFLASLNIRCFSESSELKKSIQIKIPEFGIWSESWNSCCGKADWWRRGVSPHFCSRKMISVQWNVSITQHSCLTTRIRTFAVNNNHIRTYSAPIDVTIISMSKLNDCNLLQSLALRFNLQIFLAAVSSQPFLWVFVYFVLAHLVLKQGRCLRPCKISQNTDNSNIRFLA